MKKYLSLVLAIVLISSFCVFAFAEETKNSVNTKEISYILPDNYDIEMTYAEEDYIQYSSTNYVGDLYVFCIENKELPEGVKNLDEQNAISIIEENFYAKGLYINIDSCVTKVNSLETVDVNGVSACEVNLCYFVTEHDYTCGALVYIMATKENIFIVAFDDCDEVFDNFSIAENFLSSCGIYGTYFDGEKSTVSNATDDVVSFNEYATPIISEFEMFEDDASVYGTNYDNFDYYELATLGFVIIGVFLLIIVGLIVAVIVLAIFNSKKSKQIKEYQEQLTRFAQPDYNNIIPTMSVQPKTTSTLNGEPNEE